MANRIPLILDTTGDNKIRELPAEDTLDLGGANIVNVSSLQVAGTADLRNAILDYNNLENKPPIPSSILDLGIIEGANGQVLVTDGLGNFSFEDREQRFYNVSLLSDLENDTGFVTADQLGDTLANYTFFEPDVDIVGGSIYAQDSTLIVDGINGTIDYDRIVNTPSIPTSIFDLTDFESEVTSEVEFQLQNFIFDYNQLYNVPNFSPVALTGNYNDLENIPSFDIPTDLKDLNWTNKNLLGMPEFSYLRWDVTSGDFYAETIDLTVNENGSQTPDPGNLELGYGSKFIFTKPRLPEYLEELTNVATISGWQTLVKNQPEEGDLAMFEGKPYLHFDDEANAVDGQILQYQLTPGEPYGVMQWVDMDGGQAYDQTLNTNDDVEFSSLSTSSVSSATTLDLEAVTEINLFINGEREAYIDSTGLNVAAITGDIQGNIESPRIIANNVYATDIAPNTFGSSNDSSITIGNSQTSSVTLRGSDIIIDGDFSTTSTGSPEFASDDTITFTAPQGVLFNDIIKLPISTSAPTTPADGMVAIADGTTWNPTATGVQTMVVYLNGAWITIAQATGV